MKTPELPKGYFFRVYYGEPYVSEFSYQTEYPSDVVEIRRKHWWGGSSHVYSRKISKTGQRTPATPEQIHSAMATTKFGWEERLEEKRQIEKLYGDYPPKEL